MWDFKLVGPQSLVVLGSRVTMLFSARKQPSWPNFPTLQLGLQKSELIPLHRMANIFASPPVISDRNIPQWT